LQWYPGLAAGEDGISHSFDPCGIAIYTHYITPENRADAPSLMPLAKKGMSGDLVASAMKNPLIPFYVKL